MLSVLHNLLVLYVNTFGTANVKNSKGKILHDGEIAEIVSKLFDMRPYSIVKRLGLKNPIFPADSIIRTFRS